MKWQLTQCLQQKAGDAAGRWLARLVAAVAIVGGSASAAEILAAAQFRKDVQPILKEFCYDCHGDGAKKGDVAFDELKTVCIRNKNQTL